MVVLKAHSLTGRITYDLALKAFKAVKRNRGAAGIDKVSIKMFAQNLDQNLIKLVKDLKAVLTGPCLFDDVTSRRLPVSLGLWAFPLYAIEWLRK